MGTNVGHQYLCQDVKVYYKLRKSINNSKIYPFFQSPNQSQPIHLRGNRNKRVIFATQPHLDPTFLQHSHSHSQSSSHLTNIRYPLFSFLISQSETHLQAINPKNFILSPLRPLIRPLSGFPSRTFLKMAWHCSGTTNTELIENLFAANLITSPLVKSAMLKVDRAHFCPSPRQAYEDSPQVIGHGATISAPHMHAHACESLLEYLKPGSRVLDIGSGSGYLTAVMSELVFRQGNDGVGDEDGDGTGKVGKVVGLEHIPQLRDLGERNMSKSPRGKELLDEGNVEFVVGDGRKGYVDESKEGWDAIHVGAAAVKLHEELIEQLRAPGRMFIPVEDERGGGQYIWTVDKDVNGKVEKKRLYGVRYVPLTDAPRE